MVLPAVAPDEETLESVQEKFWCALPSIAKLRADIDAAATNNADQEAQETLGEVPDPEVSVREALVPFSEIQQLAECLFMACHTNPISEDAQSGVEKLLGNAEEKKTVMYTLEEFIGVLRDVESRWLEWPDMEQKWLAVTEKQHMSVVKELMECVTQDVEPFTLLPPQQVLTAQSVVVHTKTLVTPFEAFVDFVKPREFPQIYDTLWGLLVRPDGGQQQLKEETTATNEAEAATTTTTGKGGDTLALLPFTEFFKWLYMRAFTNATDAAAEAAARTMWLEHLGRDGTMTKVQFVEVCRCMCRQYLRVDNEEGFLEEFYWSSERLMQVSECEGGAAIFRLHEPLSNAQKLVDPNDLYAPVELDDIKHEMNVYGVDANTTRIVVYGGRGVGKTAVSRALARRLNCVLLSVEDLAAEAMTKADKGDSLGAQLLESLERDTVIPLSLLVALIRRKIAADETVYRGYVFSDIPPIYDTENADILHFLNSCGILDVLVPTVLLHLSCDDENFQAERLEATLEERRLRHQELLQLRAAEEEEESRRKALEDEIEQLQSIMKRYEDMAAADADTIEQEDLESAKAAAAEAESVLSQKLEQKKNDDGGATEVAHERAQRVKRIKSLALKRLVEHTLSPEEKRNGEVLVTALPCFQAIVERLSALDHCLTVGCTSLVEDTVSYVVDTLRLEPCVLPRDLAAAAEEEEQQEGEERQDLEATPSLEKDMETAKAMEEVAAEMGAVGCSRWKRFCPVTFAECGVLVEGTARYGCVYRQRLFYLASEVNLAKFKANPPVYLRATPLDGEPILLISTVNAQDEAQLTPDTVQELIHILQEKLCLTPMEFADFVARWDRHRNLKEMRNQALLAREKYEVTERKLRADRLKKRRALELKKKARKPNPPPKGKRGRKSTVSKPEPPEEFKGWEKEPEGPESVTSRIEKTVTERLERRKTFVPILVHAVGDMSIDAFRLLLREGVLPETVVVLQYDRPVADEDEEAASAAAAAAAAAAELAAAASEEGDDGNEGGVPRPQMPQVIMLEELDTRTRSPGGDTDEASQTFTIHRFSVNDKDASVLAAEVLQVVCPGMPPVEDGAVDETLEEADEEAEMDNADEDEEEDEDGPAIGPVDPALRPGKRFLNQFGSRLQYCPVTLYEKRLLVRGRNELCLQYRQKLYVFASEEAKAKFERNPLRYLETPPPYVPPRVWMVGYSRSGKKTLAEALHGEYSVPCFLYDREFFERCVEAARRTGGEIVNGIAIAEQKGENPYLVLAEAILKQVREFAADQERRMKLRQEAEAEMERRAQAEEKDDEDEEEDEEEVDEEAEARLQEHLEFEPEEDEDRELRLSEAYLKVASCVTRIEPFESRGYIMVCPPFSDGDMEVLFSTGGIPEVALQMELSGDMYLARNRKATASPPPSPRGDLKDQEPPAEEVPTKNWTEKERQRKERELWKWRRRHIGKDDPESEPDGENEEEQSVDREQAAGQDEDAIARALEMDRNVEEEALNEFSEAISERLVKVVVLNGDLSINAVFRAACRRLFNVFEHRRSLMHVAEVVRFDVAQKMLESGAANPSCFGNTDPVALYDGRHGVRRVCKWMPDGTAPEPEPTAEAVIAAELKDKTKDSNGDEEMEEEEEDEEQQQQQKQPQEKDTGDNILASAEGSVDDDDDDMSEHDTEEMGEILEAHERQKRREWLRRSQRAALFCGRLYFFDSDAALMRYLRDPLLFVQQPPPLPRPVKNTTISIYDEADLSHSRVGVKQRGTAHHIAFNLNYLFVSLPKLLSWAAAHAPLLSLSRHTINAVLSGSVDDILVAQLLGHRLNAADARRRGVVLLNLPRTRDQYCLLTAWGLRIDKVFQFDDIYTDVTTLIKSTATVTTSISAPRASIAAIVEITECVDACGVNEGRAALSRARGFPMSMDNTYHTFLDVKTHLSSYQWFCPYGWSMGENLLDQSSSRRHGAFYLGMYYFFSSDAFLQRFLLCPAEVTGPPGLKPLPNALPMRVQPGAEYPLELLGCCPVTLYDTRNNRGLRGVLEPLAKKGDPKCIVVYDGRYYALLDEAMVERFLMRPWQYIEGASLPPQRKQPLPEGQALSTIDEENFMRRVLYDPVARALIAVAEARPKYPGLSLEESALKFMALHMKCFNDKCTPIQAEQYKANFEIFQKRATLYKTMTEASEDMVHGEGFSDLCCEWEKATDHMEGNVSTLVHLRQVE
ncbi:hypothetical protein DQ04_00351140 [Trypanosoma grayi]|uniref:hypothetical protein n=1 Tax=Trypanosoma grayi TaxID=71804 RepID=UPI0004F48437|nr:hypothetical protein DQ04_00351140 [Trypanosoma grayi]KEG14677.1 hypothetical protein DQ04_00351140 [Trypanosoma grayi]